MKQILKKWWRFQLAFLLAAIALPLITYNTGYSYVSEAAIWIFVGILTLAMLAPFKWG